MAILVVSAPFIMVLLFVFIALAGNAIYVVSTE